MKKKIEVKEEVVEKVMTSHEKDEAERNKLMVEKANREQNHA
jgi:hypothetical protein